MESMQEYMVTYPSDGSKDFVIVGMVFSSNKQVSPDQEHLACFVAGSLAMGSKYLDRPQDMVMAKKIAQGCYMTYHFSETGLGPEAVKFDTEPGSDGKLFEVNKDTFYSRGLSRSEYILRPETVESLWILYRLTGDRKYPEQAWEILFAFCPPPPPPLW